MALHSSSLRSSPRAFTLVEMLVVIVIIALLAGVSTTVILQFAREQAEATTRNELRSHPQNARARASSEDRRAAVLFYQWRLTGDLLLPDDSNAVGLTQVRSVVEDPANPGIFLPVDNAWIPVPDDYTAVAPGQQYVQLGPGAPELVYPNDPADLDPTAAVGTGDRPVLGVGFAILFNRDGSLASQPLAAGGRFVELVQINNDQAAVATQLDRPGGAPDVVYALDTEILDWVDPNELLGVSDNESLAIERSRLDSMAALPMASGFSSGLSAIDDAAMALPIDFDGGRGPAGLEDVQLTGGLGEFVYVIDREPPGAVSFTSGQTIAWSSDVPASGPDEAVDDGDGDLATGGVDVLPRVFVAARAFGLASQYAIVETDTFSDHREATVAAVGDDQWRIADERAFQPRLAWPRRETDSGQWSGEYTDDIFGDINAFEAAAAEWTWVVIDPLSGQIAQVARNDGITPP
ncbi:MAG: prepilin-type N-terminal cleavage/methylation domain-containing protein [Planctomycetota bacterium]